MFYRVRHALASAREVVWLMLVNSGPYVLTLLGIGALAWFIWGRQDTVNPDEIAAQTVGSEGNAYAEAMAWVEAGAPAKARAGMQALAPIGGGDVRAHWWMAQDLLQQVGETEARGVAKVLMDQAQAHLREVVARDEENLEALPLLARAYVWMAKSSGLSPWSMPMPLDCRRSISSLPIWRVAWGTCEGARGTPLRRRPTLRG